MKKFDESACAEGMTKSVRRFGSLLSAESAKSAAHLLEWVCIFAVIFSIGGVFLSIAGRQTFIFHSHGIIFEDASFAGMNHDYEFARGPFTSARGEFRIHSVPGTEQVDFITRAALSAAYIIHAVPIAIAFLFLAKVFKNIGAGEIFTEQNAHFVLYFGLIQIFANVFVPVLQFIICGAANLFTESQITLLTNNWILGGIPYIACIVAAYVIRRGAAR